MSSNFLIFLSIMPLFISSNLASFAAESEFDPDPESLSLVERSLSEREGG
jgi:hypothetical protein